MDKRPVPQECQKPRKMLRNIRSARRIAKRSLQPRQDSKNQRHGQIIERPDPQNSPHVGHGDDWGRVHLSLKAPDERGGGLQAAAADCETQFFPLLKGILVMDPLSIFLVNLLMSLLSLLMNGMPPTL